MITYNHEKYIKQAIDSILDQETEHTFEIVIGDDFSTDSTREILLEYVKKYPDKVKLILQRENIGQLRNSEEVLKNCSGRYLSICEGDDFWHNKNKMQFQVDFLDAHSEIGVIHGDVDHLIDETGALISRYNHTNSIIIPDPLTFEDFLFTDEHLIKTMSSCIRTDLLKKYYTLSTSIEHNWKLGDLPVWLELVNHTIIKYVDISFATYRILKESASQTRNPEKKMAFHESIHEIRLYYANKFNCSKEVKRKVLVNYNKVLLFDSFRTGNTTKAKNAIEEEKKLTSEISFKSRILYLLVRSKIINSLANYLYTVIKRI